MGSTGLFLARLASAMWLGAAFLFVATSVAEQTHPALPVPAKNLVAVIRFPWFYTIGAVFLSIALLSSLAIRRPPRGVAVASVLLMAALVIMFLDYAFIFRPMREEIRANFLERTDRFQTLHSWSEGVNSFEYLLVLIATVLLLAARSSAPSEGHPPAAAIPTAAIPTDGTAASKRPSSHGGSPVEPHP